MSVTGASFTVLAENTPVTVLLPGTAIQRYSGRLEEL